MKRLNVVHIVSVMSLVLGLIVILASCGKLEDGPSSPLSTNPDAIVIPASSTSSDTNTNTNSPDVTVSRGQTVLFDSLMNGSSVGTVAGGTFIPGVGYHIPVNVGGYLAYSTSITGANIQVEFYAKGYLPMEDDGMSGKMIIFRISDTSINTSWTGGGSEWNTNSMFELRKKGSNAFNPDAIETKFGGRGTWEEMRSSSGQSPAGSTLSWDPNTPYYWVITIKDGSMKITRNGQVIFEGGCAVFRPSGALNIVIGGTPIGWSGPRDVTYSNVLISIP